MSASGKTSNLQLPIYANSDEPKYIPDFNDAMTKIDVGYASNLSKINANTASIETTNENVTAVQATANQALSTGNQALEKLININDITFSVTETGWTLSSSLLKVVNGFLVGVLYLNSSTSTLQPIINCNYNIAGDVIIVYGCYIEFIYFSNGVSSQIQRSSASFGIYFNIPWDSTWTKKT